MAEKYDKTLGGIKVIEKSNRHYNIRYGTGEKARLSILNDHVFRYYMSPSGKFLEYPVPKNPDDIAKMVVKTAGDYGFGAFKESTLVDLPAHYIVQTRNILIVFDKITGTVKVHNTRADKEIFNETRPISYIDWQSTQNLNNEGHSIQYLSQRKDEHFFGGGMQNGKFAHKGESIDILNTNIWTDGGVASPCPFYWSSYGYGVLRNTWQPGTYDFGETSSDYIKTFHHSEDFDAYYFINTSPKDILNDYFELTGQPILIPEYAYYEAHLNAFNRDYWVEVSSDTSRAILFEDGKYYKSYQPSEIGDRKGILESLNGEKNNYQFSARAMVDRYKRHDIPLGWFIPNDGYGSGYGQTDTLDGDIQNLKGFVEYSLKNGVEVGLWTESNLHPKDPFNPKKGERDLSKEVGIANVVALKCDVAWIGSGYSFGLSSVENAAEIFVNGARNTIRPMIIMVDGWAGTQRYAGIWSGDQGGGEWEYIRFHIPTYIGTGLSGQPLVGSDMDGIYYGGCKEVNVRDYQWKAFTPLQLNMDGWGNTQKTPFSFDKEATDINRAYLKLKSMLMPYNYSIGYESIHGLPMVRAMFLEFPEESSAYTKDSQYQYMWGPNILVAPIYNDYTNGEGHSIRDGIYLPNPDQVWIDFLTGDKYQGGKIYNNIIAPLWKIPIFVKDGSIIPMTNPNNNPYEIKRDLRTFTMYPNGKSKFLLYEDDGISSDYLKGLAGYATTKIEVTGPNSNEIGDLVIKIFKTSGNYKNMTKKRRTVLQIMTSKDVKHLKIDASGQSIVVRKVKNLNEFESRDNVFFYNEDFILNPYLNEYAKLKQKFLLIKLETLDVTTNKITVKVKDYTNYDSKFENVQANSQAPNMISRFQSNDSKSTATTITLDWQDFETTDYYEIDRDGLIFTNILQKSFSFENLAFKSSHDFKIRSVTNNIASEWSNIISVSTRSDPFQHLIYGVNVTCNLPCQPNQEPSNLTERSVTSMWHTDWGKDGQANPEEGKFIELLFDLGDVYELDKVAYQPRDDVGNGTFLKIQYRYSTNNSDWSELSDPIQLKSDKSVKTIPFNGTKVRYLQLVVLESVSNFGSGKKMLFYKK